MIQYYQLKYKFGLNFTKIFASVNYVFLYLFQDSTLYVIALRSFNCLQQILVN